MYFLKPERHWKGNSYSKYFLSALVHEIRTLWTKSSVSCLHWSSSSQSQVLFYTSVKCQVENVISSSISLSMSGNLTIHIGKWLKFVLTWVWIEQIDTWCLILWRHAELNTCNIHPIHLYIQTMTTVHKSCQRKSLTLELWYSSHCDSYQARRYLSISHCWWNHWNCAI